MYTQNILCSTNNSKKYFYLIEEIRNYAERLANLKFIVHWIPSHIENTEYGRLPIEGNLRADQLAEIAQLEDCDRSTVDISLIRDKILHSSAKLISNINDILFTTLTSLSFDGTSSDDFSNSDAIRDLSRKRRFRDI